MFDETKNVPQTPAGSTQPTGSTEDIFAGVDSAVNNNQPRPVVFEPRPPQSPSSLVSETIEPVTDNKKYFVLGALIFGIILVAVAGYYGFKNFSAISAVFKGGAQTNQDPTGPTVNETENTADQNQDNNVAPANLNEAANEVVSGVATTSLDLPVATSTPPVDSDDDGLIDEDEIKLGTNPNLVDSDSDNLFDYEELRVYGTDPVNPDTDHDSYKDGDEVKAGFNPLGAGKLTDVKKEN